jgi:hypothetical protein
MAEMFDKTGTSNRPPLVRIVTLVAVGVGGVFILPWFVPFRQPVNSLSYTCGFDNTAAWIAVAVLLAVALLMRVAKGEGPGPDTWKGCSPELSTTIP